MHMADALLSPSVGLTMWGVSAGAIAYCSAKGRSEANEKVMPLMGVLGAFVFAAQMFTFTIPGTGSSSHLCGGLLLAILLRPNQAFLTLASVLVVQALFFGDGGLLALGCNIFNMAFVIMFVVYPMIFCPILGKSPGRGRMVSAIMLSTVAGLQLGAFCVALETCLSGITEIPLSAFMLLMQPIHLAMGIVEGAITIAVVTYLGLVRPDIFNFDVMRRGDGNKGLVWNNVK